ncbi:MAG: PH domain-containing protein [Gordonia sp. (in: high G+C Gram-positive bacteria)]
MPDPAPARSVSFGVSRLSYLTAPVTLLLNLMLLGISVPWFLWTLIIPVFQVWWIAHRKTVVDGDGITAVGAFNSTRLGWDDVDGLRFGKWTAVRAVRPDGSAVALPGVMFGDLPKLSAASGGRIPDPYAAAREAEAAAQD